MSAEILALHQRGRCVGVVVEDRVYTHNFSLSWPREGWAVVPLDQVPTVLRDGLLHAARENARASHGPCPTVNSEAVARADLLDSLRTVGPSTARALAEETGRSRTAVQSALGTMFGLGLVVRTADEAARIDTRGPPPFVYAVVPAGLDWLREHEARQAVSSTERPRNLVSA